MTESELTKQYNELSASLEQRKLKPAFDLLEKLITENNLGIYYDEYRNLEETYHFMLKYTVEGITDPERQKVYRKLIISVFELADKIYEAVRFRFSPSIEYEKKRIFKNNFITELKAFITKLEDYYLDWNTTADRESFKEGYRDPEIHNQKMHRLFYHVWFSDRIGQPEKEALLEFFLSPVISVPYKSFIVSSVILSLQRYFDEEKFSILFEIFDFHSGT